MSFPVGCFFGSPCVALLVSRWLLHWFCSVCCAGVFLFVSVVILWLFRWSFVRCFVDCLMVVSLVFLLACSLAFVLFISWVSGCVCLVSIRLFLLFSFGCCVAPPVVFLCCLSVCFPSVVSLVSVWLFCRVFVGVRLVCYSGFRYHCRLCFVCSFL